MYNHIKVAQLLSDAVLGCQAVHPNAWDNPHIHLSCVWLTTLKSSGCNEPLTVMVHLYPLVLWLPSLLASYWIEYRAILDSLLMSVQSDIGSLQGGLSTRSVYNRTQSPYIHVHHVHWECIILCSRIWLHENSIGLSSYKCRYVPVRESAHRDIIIPLTIQCLLMFPLQWSRGIKTSSMALPAIYIYQ